MPSYSTNDPKGWCGDPARGAALGRATIHEAEPDEDLKLVLRRVRLDSGGYDPNGTYFGIGAPLYWYANEEGSVDAVVRAQCRNEAKKKVRAHYPKARFYN